MPAQQRRKNLARPVTSTGIQPQVLAPVSVLVDPGGNLILTYSSIVNLLSPPAWPTVNGVAPTQVLSNGSTELTAFYSSPPAPGDVVVIPDWPPEARGENGQWLAPISITLGFPQINLNNQPYLVAMFADGPNTFRLIYSEQVHVFGSVTFDSPTLGQSLSVIDGGNLNDVMVEFATPILDSPLIILLPNSELKGAFSEIPVGPGTFRSTL
jgi:hypothetical protein